jgi:putative FmdB family regulatory protein
MPIYEYKCEKGHVFDVIQKFSDEPLTECQECGAPAVRVLHSPAIHFKGSGFHNTDYGKGKGGVNGGASSDSGESKPAEPTSSDSSSDSGSSDSKPSESKSSDSKAKAAAGD